MIHRHLSGFILCLAAAQCVLATPVAAQRPNLPMGLPEARYQHSVEKDIWVTMPDGVRLATDLYKPEGAGEKLPVILIRLPYDKNNYGGATVPAEFFAGQGYMVVVQDVRGQYSSEGDYRVQITDAQDGYDAIDWIVKQPWSSGKVGTYGCSYLGEVQYLLATKRHPAHVAMIPQSASGAVGPAGGFYTNFGVIDGGALTLSSIFGWFTTAGHKVRAPSRAALARSRESIDFPQMLRSLPILTMARRANLPESDWEDYVSHPPADPYWAEVGYLSDDHRFDTPSLHVNSWLDLTPEQTLYAFNLMRRNAESERGGDNQFVIMSPTVHCSSERGASEHTMVGARDVGDARFPYYEFYLDWFDYWVKGIDNGVTELPKVHYYVMGLGEWRSADTWPVPEMTPVPYYLASAGDARSSEGNGTLSPTTPAREGRDTFVYDPATPFPSRGGTICCTGNPDDVGGIFDQSDLELRDDVLVYTTTPLEEGVTIAGSVTAVLYISSDAKDTDFTAKLIDVDSEGNSWNVVNGILRVRYREGMDKPTRLEPGEVYRIEVSLKATAHHFQPGHRIRLDVSSSDFPMYDRNLNTGGDNFTETIWVTATNVVRHGGRYASHVLLPVVN
jgi:hypothetical protein